MCIRDQLVSRGLRGRRGVLLASGRYLRLQVPLGAVTCCRVRPSRAVEIRLAMAFASCRSDIWSASLMLGTIRPWGVAAAIPRLTYFLTTISWAPRPGRRSGYGTTRGGGERPPHAALADLQAREPKMSFDDLRIEVRGWSTASSDPSGNCSAVPPRCLMSRGPG